MSATEVLKEEHRVIERMLRILESTAAKLEMDEEVPPERLMKSLDFIRTFADKCHHGKEEDTLFPALEKHGLPREGGPIGVMLLEHDEGRRFVRSLAEGVERYARGDKTARGAIIDNARGYAKLLNAHIYKEDNVLYPMADRMLSAEEVRELLEKYEEIERERIGEGKHHEYLHLIEELEKGL
ncbi:MAG: hemerythrin domain-containing protein [Chloroflexi bacterium]|nr:hemerythrin domain-containing protein [Chloroflexota bacterium]MCL5074054.1 hemerythrin domain-containing protein [Chloroflexota bacterium]